MKKFIALTAAAIASLMLFAGCGFYSKPPASTGGNIGGDGGGKNPVNKDTAFKVTIVYNGSQYIPTNGVTAQWYDGIGKTTAPFNEEGVAEKTGLNGDYRVTLLGLDNSFTYDPNIYFATNDDPEVEIELHSISSVTGKGVAYNEYVLRTTGYYRATFNSEAEAKKGLMFLYVPTKEGKYSIESIVDITANEINPIAQFYVGSSAFFSEYSYTTLDTGGASSSYTKNFKYDVQLRKDEIGNVFRYLIKFNSRVSNVQYPFNIDFHVSYRGAADNDDPYKTRPVAVTEDFAARKAQIPDWNQTGKSWKYAYENRPNGKYLLGENFKFNEEDGLWHVWDGKNFGEVLWAIINEDSDILSPDNAHVGFMHPLVNKTNLNGYNYLKFVETYAQNTNSRADDYGGRYPVTAELKGFLQNYAVSQRYFMDGDGWAEKLGNKSTEEDQWLFNCGYYVN